MEKIAQIQKLFFAPSRLYGKFYLQKLLKSRVVCFAFLLMFVLFLTDCKSETNQLQRNVPTREVFDDLGRSIKVPAKVERAVSLAPNLTEIVFAVGAGDRLVGVTTFCNYPQEAQKIQKVGDTINPNIENIIALKPQIVLVSTASQIENFINQLEAQNIRVFVTHPDGLDDIYKSVEKIGEIFGETEKARRIISDLEKRVSQLQAQTNKPDGAAKQAVKVFVQISKEPLFTVGKQSFLTDLVRRAGGVSLTENVAAAYPKLSKETALALNPEAIILSDSEDNREPNDVFKNSPAVKNGKVFRVDADILSRPAPRIVDALELIARDLHPESFR